MLDAIQSYIGTFFSKEYVLKKVLRMNDADIDEMNLQIRKELDTDSEDGGIDMPDEGDGITRYPQDATGSVVPPEAMPDGEEPEEEDKKEPEDDLEDDKSFLVKNGLKGRKKWVENL